MAMNKEWKGNTKSVSSMLGMSTTWHPEQRAGGDYYTTDPEAVKEFLNKFFIPRESVVWEPACGSGNISNVLVENGYNVVSTDLYDRGYGVFGFDFLETEKVPDNCSLIMTNPPYSLADEFILHALEILPYNGRAAFLLNISYLSGKRRYKDIYSKHFLDLVYIYSHRINCYKNNENTGHSSPVNYGWFVFRKNNYITEPKIYWI